MRSAFLIVFVCFVNMPVFCQNKDSLKQVDFIKKTMTEAARFNTVQKGFTNTARPVIKAPASLLRKQGLLAQFLKQAPAKNNFTDTGISRYNNSGRVNNLCEDTSYARLMGVYNGWLYIQSVTQTIDGGMLIPALMYDSTLLPHPFWKTYGLLIKLDGDGNVIWIKQFDDLTQSDVSEFIMTRAFELPNHDIICAGLLSNNGSSDVYKTLIYRLTANGDITWKNNIESTIEIFNSPKGTFTFRPESAVDGLNGDVILCGSTNSNLSNGKIETVIRLDSRGQLVWDANYGNHGVNGSYLFGSEGITAFMQNGQIVLVGLSHGTNYPQTAPAVNFLTLDYNNGNELNRRFFRPDYSDDLEEFYKSFTFYANKCTRLSNGHILFYGKLFSDFVKATPVIDHFGVIEFDTAFNLVNSYTISSGLFTNYYNNLLHFDPSGKGLISTFEYLDSYEGNVFFGAFSNQQFQNQRKAHYTNAGMPGNNGFAFLNDNGYAYIQTYFQADPEIKSYFEFRKMHNSDTSSQCLGKDTLLLRFLPLHIIEDPGYYFLDPNEPNKMEALAQNISQTDTLSSGSLDPCKQINYCDTVKIHGNPVICGNGPSLLFTAFKNNSCGAIVQWKIDKTAVDSFYVLNDTSVRIWFKNINWQGKLYATLPAGSCNVPALDSIAVTVIRLQSHLTLGPDTTLCNQNNMVLHAGNSFSGYVWQDGSSDSTFTVYQPGKYYVTANDACGNIFSDTVNIAAAVYPFTIGADTIRCNNDTLQLNATAGFSNYQWYNNYNISSAAGQSVNVYPAVDTFYYATAEKRPGCIVRDTIHINVRSSPPVFLGADTSLCTGQFLNLDAGPGFLSYLWSNGSTGRQLTVNQAGTYFIKALAGNTCASYDTLQILNVSPLPVFSLGNDTTICEGKFYHFTFNLPNATYLWQDGNRSSQYSISREGQYVLAVTQAGCTSRDTAEVLYRENPTVYLGKDTSICTGSNYLLSADYPGAAYIWQDGSTGSRFIVTQPGNFNVMLDLNGCYASDTIVVTYIPKPFFSLGKDTIICNDQSFLLQPVLNTAVDYFWQDGSTSKNFTVTKPGLFSLSASNNCGIYTDDIIVTEGLCKLVMPNSFTPNGDGLNDVFRVKYPFAVKEFQFFIYNRFGEKIFETRDMQKGWDGTWKSVKQDTGSYIWIIKIKGLNDNTETSSGTITIIR